MKSKRLLLLLLVALLAPWAAMAQNRQIVEIGTGSSTTYYPMPGFYGFQYDVYLYTPTAAPELGVDSDISSIAYNLSTTSSSTGATIEIWVKDVDASFALASSTTFADYTSEATKVVDDNAFTTDATGWKTMDFSSTFSHQGGKALLVAVRGVGCSTGGGCSRSSYYTTASGMHWYKRADNTDPGTSATGSLDGNRSNIRLDVTYTGAVCFAPTNLTCTTYTATTATLEWTENGEATSWYLEYSQDNTFTNSDFVNVSGTPTTTLQNLTPEQTYYARVKPDCDTDGTKWSNVCEFKPSNVFCNEIGTGSATAYLVYTSYGCTYSQHIYTASELTAMGFSAGNIVSVSFYYSGTSSSYQKTQSIYMGTTTKSSYSGGNASDFESDVTLVYGPTLLSYVAGWREYELTEPFEWDGISNIVVGMLTNSTQSSSSGWSAYGTSTSPDYRTIYRYRDSNPIDITNLSSVSNGSYSTTRPNINLCILPSSTPKPRNIQVNDITASQATVSWEAPASATPTGYEFMYKLASDEWPSSWTSSNGQTSVDLTGLSANTTYDFCVRAVYGTDYSDPAETSFTTLATCLVPEGLAVNDMVATWTAGAASQWKLQYKKSVDTEWTPVNDLTAATYNFANANLDAITNYDVQVRADCGNGDLSEWTATVSFTTPCATYDIPYTYDFEAEAPFACWTPITGVTRANSTYNAHNSTYYLRFAGTNSNLVALPQFNEATNNLRVEFWTRPESSSAPSSTSNYSGKFAVGYMTDITDASTFVAVETYNSTEMTTTYVKKTVDFVNVPANASIAMRQFDCATNYYWFVDDVTVKLIPSCLAPSGLSATVTAHEAELSWTANSGETAWTLYWKKTTDENYTDVANATNPYTLNGLDAATNYQYYVVANCSADDASEASEVFAFVTECEAIPTFPWTENFDSYTGATSGSTNNLPLCWNYINTSTYSYYKGYPVIYSGSSYSNSGNNHLRFYSYYSSYSNYDPQDQYAILPEMSSLAGKEVVLYARGYNDNSTFKIGTMSDPDDASTFVPITEQALTTSYQKFSYIILAGRTDSYLAIMIDAATSSRTTNGVYIDDITVKEMVTVDADKIVAANPGEGQMTWSQFAEHVNNGDHFTNPTITLMENITITEMVGTAENPFTGTFDGNGKTITADITSGETAAAPFHYIKDATIKNLTMTGTVTETATTSDGYHAGGLVGYAWSGYNIIENCRVSTDVTIAGYGGGIVGHGKTSVVFLKGCVYEGTITNALNVDGNNKGVGGLVGWFDGGAALNIHDSYYDGTYTENEGVSVYFHPVACKTGGASVTVNIYDCYYTCDNPAADSDGTNNVVTNAGQKAYKVTGAEGITVNLRAATTHYSCSGISGDDNATWNGIKIGDDIYGGEGVTLTLALEGANGYEADHGTLTPISTTYTLLMEASNTVISGVDCPVPYNVEVSNVEARSAQVTWTGASDSYTLDYAQAVETTTTYDFEDNAISAEFTNSATYAWTVTTNDKHDGSYSIKSGGAGTNNAISDLTLTLNLQNDATISFWYKASSEANYDYGRFLIDGSQKFQTSGTSNEWTQYTGELTSGTHTLVWRYYKDGSGNYGDDCFYVDDITVPGLTAGTWTYIDNIPASPYTIDNLTPETKYFVRVKGICVGTETEYSDMVSFTTPASCIVPTGLAVSDVTTNSAYASWTAGGSETLYVVAYKKSTDADWTEVENRVDQTFYTLSNLDAATDYEVRVRSYCDADDQSDWTDAVYFTTECEAVTDLPWNENFDAYTGSTSTMVPTGYPNDELPMCWQFLNRSDNSSTYPQVFISSNSGYPVSGNCLFFKSSSTTPLYAILPAFEEEIAGLQLTFTYRNEGISTSNGTLIVGYMSNPADATTFTTVLTCERTTTLTEKEAQFTNAPAGSCIAFKYQGGSSDNYYLSIDNVKVDFIPTCTKPTDLTFMSSTTTTAILSWTAGADETAWQICINGDETNLIPANSNPFTVEGLTAATNYTAKVRAYCSADDQSDWSNEVSFVTECVVIVVDAAHPYTQGFEDSDDIPTCWETIPTTYYGSEHDWQIDDYENHSGEKSAFSEYYGPVYLIMPDLQLANGTAAQLTFWSYNNYVTDYDKNSVVLLDGENEIELWSPESVVEYWEETTIDLTAYMGQTISLAFKYEGDNAHGWYVDDVKVEVLPFTKTIAAVGEEGWESGKGGYYFIASPVTEPVTPTANNGFIVGDYDLYYFDQACDADGNEWINFKTNDEGYNLTNGKGYLYASKEGTTLTFTGTPGTDGTVTLDTYDGDARFKGWNLIGNPFAQTAYITKAFYTLENSDTYTPNEAGTAIQPMQGVLIVAEEDETSVTFSTEAPAVQSGSKLNMNLSRANKQLDNAILVFGGDQQLGKMTFRANSSKIFMPVEGKDYAITSVEGQVGEVPVSFVPENNGTYSLSFTSEEVSFSYLHLIDNMTGNDVNLLQTPSYTFDARTTDYESRFRLVFATGSSTGSDTFGFVNASGNFCIFGIEGEATVQVIDVLGHVLSSETFSGSYEKRINGAPGVYMVRLIQGNDVRVQKMVVR